MDMKYDVLDPSVGSDVDVSIDIKYEPVNISFDDEMATPALVAIKEEAVDSTVEDVPIQVKEESADTSAAERNSHDLVTNEFLTEPVFVSVKGSNSYTETGMENDRRVMVEQKYLDSKDPLHDIGDFSLCGTDASTDSCSPIAKGRIPLCSDPVADVSSVVLRQIKDPSNSVLKQYQNTRRLKNRDESSWEETPVAVATDPQQSNECQLEESRTFGCMKQGEELTPESSHGGTLLVGSEGTPHDPAGSQVEPNTSTDTGTVTAKSLYSCDVCPATFFVESDLDTHKQSQHEDRCFKCDICAASFVTRTLLIKHLKNHSKKRPYSCDLCKISYLTNSGLIKHKHTHTGGKPFTCDMCMKSFTKINYLTKHKRTHTGEKPFTCEVCKRSFYKTSNLNRHMRTHTGEKPFTCEVCRKCFTLKINLCVHKRTHTGEKPFTCEVCTKRFTYKSNLSVHKRTHTGEKPYTCEVCKMSFLRNSQLKSHMQDHTGEKSST